MKLVKPLVSILPLAFAGRWESSNHNTDGVIDNKWPWIAEKNAFVIPYYIEKSEYSDDLYERVRFNLNWVNEQLEPLQIQLEELNEMPYSRKRDYLYVQNKMPCMSMVGNVRNGPQKLHLGGSCGAYHFTALHEILHTLGWIHEHQRPDRDDFINIPNFKKSDKGEPWKKLKFETWEAWNGECGKEEGDWINTFGTTYDVNTAMQRSEGYCGLSYKNNYKPRYDGKALSELDTIEIRAAYTDNEKAKNVNYEKPIGNRLGEQTYGEMNRYVAFEAVNYGGDYDYGLAIPNRKRPKPGDKLTIERKAGNEWQGAARFDAFQNEDGYMNLKPANWNLCVGIKNNKAFEGAELELQCCDGSRGQNWFREGTQTGLMFFNGFDQRSKFIMSLGKNQNLILSENKDQDADSYLEWGDDYEYWRSLKEFKHGQCPGGNDFVTDGDIECGRWEQFVDGYGCRDSYGCNCLDGKARFSGWCDPAITKELFGSDEPDNCAKGHCNEGFKWVAKEWPDKTVRGECICDNDWQDCDNLAPTCKWFEESLMGTCQSIYGCNCKNGKYDNSGWCGWDFWKSQGGQWPVADNCRECNPGYSLVNRTWPDGSVRKECV